MGLFAQTRHANLCCGQQARGVAVAYGKVYAAQLDGHVVALDARTGKEIWKTDHANALPQPAYFYSFTNLATATTTPYTNHTTTNSVFGAVDLDYKSLFFLSLTGRKDWFSTLSPKHYGIFYPSIGGSFILSDAVRLPAIFNLTKIRGSWARVGGGAPDPYAINLTYSSAPSSGQPLQDVTSGIIANPDLKPFTSTTYEAGLELSMLNSRLGLDVTLYNRKTTNEILQTTISTTSGYSGVYLNIGELDNKGIEALFTGTPVKRGDFSWNVSYNVAYNNNKVVQLAPGLPSVPVASSVNGYTTRSDGPVPHGEPGCARPGDDAPFPERGCTRNDHRRSRPLG